MGPLRQNQNNPMKNVFWWRTFFLENGWIILPSIIQIAYLFTPVVIVQQKPIKVSYLKAEDLKVFLW